MRISSFTNIRFGVVILAGVISNGCLVAQNFSGATTQSISALSSSSVSIGVLDSSNDDTSMAASANSAQATNHYGAVTPGRYRPFSKVGIDGHVGINGIGFDVATNVAKKFNVRAGADFFSYGTSFQEQGADVTADLRLRSGHASLDWFPFGNGFRLSPLVSFGNNNRVVATALVPSGSTITLNGQDYISSMTDPLHGAGSVDFRKVSPGFSLGFGNIIPRNKSHFSIPVEAGFYYVGQPGLKVNFTGSACDPTEPPAIGCENVDSDPGFQHDLAAFIARNNHNVSYASFFPIFSVGLGYRF
jgi:hypothetical protein